MRRAAGAAPLGSGWSRDGAEGSRVELHPGSDPLPRSSSAILFRVTRARISDWSFLCRSSSCTDIQWPKSVYTRLSTPERLDELALLRQRRLDHAVLLQPLLDLGRNGSGRRGVLARSPNLSFQHRTPASRRPRPESKCDWGDKRLREPIPAPDQSPRRSSVRRSAPDTEGTGLEPELLGAVPGAARTEFPPVPQPHSPRTHETVVIRALTPFRLGRPPSTSGAPNGNCRNTRRRAH
jgi:hypothetical protein